ncbi:hypothetical protein [Halioxenophilus sp. WMMB6]|uniref:hypothetical protein n=1 Tax=Halioxenophilus sp. WMMB6 TaxID=3073815 RepID=UPI00295F3C5E|nr:hypothetical protein [Halioxenophilus sp. WMMB6]
MSYGDVGAHNTCSWIFPDRLVPLSDEHWVDNVHWNSQIYVERKQFFENEILSNADNKNFHRRKILDDSENGYRFYLFGDYSKEKNVFVGITWAVIEDLGEDKVIYLNNIPKNEISLFTSDCLRNISNRLSNLDLDKCP